MLRVSDWGNRKVWWRYNDGRRDRENRRCSAETRRNDRDEEGKTYVSMAESGFL